MNKAKTTRDHIIDHAGPIFAEKGFANATGKAICLSANVNAAAINYHFGGIDGLYEAVLDRVTDRMMTFDAMDSVIQSDTNLRTRAEAFISPLIDLIFADDEANWMFKVAGHEIVAPTSTSSNFFTALQHVGKVAMEFVDSATGLDSGHPAFPAISAMILAGMQWLVVADRGQMAKMYPGLQFTPEAREVIKSAMLDFTLGGLQAAVRPLCIKDTDLNRQT